MESQAEALNELSADELDGKAWLLLPKIEKNVKIIHRIFNISQLFNFLNVVCYA